MRPFSRYPSALAATIVLFLSPLHAGAFNYAILPAPPAQVNNATCQSYTLALALALQEPVGVQNFKWRVESIDQLRLLESEIRTQVLSAGVVRRQNDPTSPNGNTRGDWKKAIRIYTDGQFQVIDEKFSKQDDVWEFLEKNLVLQAPMAASSPYPIATPYRTYIASFSNIEGQKYPSGHIVSVVGIERKSPGSQPSLFLINSAAQYEDHECLVPLDPFKKPGKFKEYRISITTAEGREENSWRYVGHAGWTTDYVMKTFEGGIYRLNWIEPVPPPTPKSAAKKKVASKKK